MGNMCGYHCKERRICVTTILRNGGYVWLPWQGMGDMCDYHCKEWGICVTTIVRNGGYMRLPLYRMGGQHLIHSGISLSGYFTALLPVLLGVHTSFRLWRSTWSQQKSANGAGFSSQWLQCWIYCTWYSQLNCSVFNLDWDAGEVHICWESTAKVVSLSAICQM